MLSVADQKHKKVGQDDLRNIVRLEELLDALSEMVQVIDAKTLQVDFSSKSLLQILKYSDEQIHALGPDGVASIVHPSDLPFFQNYIKNLPNLKRGDRSSCVYRARHASGSWCKIETINTVLSADEKGTAEKIAGLTRELAEDEKSLNERTDTSKTMHRCKNCQKLLGIERPDDALLEIKCNRCGEINGILRPDLIDLFSSTVSKVYLTDDKGTILYINDAVFVVSGYTPEEVIGHTPSVWGKQMSLDFYLNMYQMIKVDKRSISHQVKNKHKDGRLYSASVQISPILDRNEQVKYFVGIETVIDT